MMTLQDYVDLLDSCQTADEVAELCRMHGVRGERSDIGECPVARLGRKLVGDDSLWAGPARVCSYVGPEATAIKYFSSEAPVEFIAEFDAGAYPDLEAVS